MTLLESGVVKDMPSPKQAVLDLVRDLPEDTSLEDIQYHLYVLQRVEKGLQEVEQGKLIPEDEMEKRFAKWIVP
jgi:predicted transcriptional regulator